jgi:outer membrane lipoprotein SlyB
MSTKRTNVSSLYARLGYRVVGLVPAAAAIAALAGCAVQPTNGPVYGSGNTESVTRIAVIDSVRDATLKRDASGTLQAYLGQTAGAVLGGLIGNQVGKGGGKQVATAGGAVAGAAVSSKVQQSAGEVPAVELTYTLVGCQGAECTRTTVQTAMAHPSGRVTASASPTATAFASFPCKRSQPWP